MNSATDKSLLVVLVGYFAGHTGYNIHTTKLAEALSQKASVVRIDLQDQAPVNQQKLSQVSALSRSRPDLVRINLHINHPSLITNYLDWPGYHCCYAIWESTRLPPDWLPVLQQVHQVWSPSHWGTEVLQAHGIETSRIRIVPEGVDTAVFNTDAPALEALAQLPGTKFINVGKYEERKGTADLIRLFDRTFRSEDVYLVLLSHNPFIAGFNLSKEVDGMNLNRRERILCIDPLPNQQLVASLYTACDVGVFPTRAEGWGLPITDAMACGLPVIVTQYSAVTEYFTDACGYGLGFELEPIKEKLFKTEDDDQGNWAKPKEKELVAALRLCAEGGGDLNEKGVVAQQRIVGQFTWQHAADRALSVMLELVESNETV